MEKRPLTFADPGHFEILCHHSPATVYPEETHETVQVCIPFERALYSVTRQSETGRTVIHHLGARDVLVVPAGQPHRVTWRRPADIVSLHMSERFISQAIGRPQLRLADSFTLRDPFISAAALQIRMSAAGDEGQPSLIFADAIATAIAYRVAIGAATDCRFRPKGDAAAFSRPQLARIDAFIDAHLDQAICLAALAKLMDLSVWHFIRRFNASQGLSPHAYITRRRLERAQILLVETQLSITEIALEVGLSHSHFSRSFLSRFGISPREFRRQRLS
jgi:AraC family transcriptional regulator